MNHNDLRFTLFIYLFACSFREIVRSLGGGHSAEELSVVGSESRGLVRKGSTFAAIIARAPATSLAESSTSAFPGLGALLGTLPVVRLRDGAVLVVGVSSSVPSPLVVPQLLSVVVGLSGPWDVLVAEADAGRELSVGLVVLEQLANGLEDGAAFNLEVLKIGVSGAHNGGESSNSKVFHLSLIHI